jgi:hypothetical protein
MDIKIKVIVFLSLSALSVSSIAQSVPELINYQGRLTDTDGPIPDDTYKLEFNIYDAATTGNKVWGPQVFKAVPVVNGLFNVILGEQETDQDGVQLTDGAHILTAFSSSKRYLGIKVNSGSEITPRQQILSAPYALKARNVVPVGTIVSSILTPEQYAIEVGDDASCATVSTNSTCQWAYANGRTVTGSRYASITNIPFPNLQDQFLRGKGTVYSEPSVGDYQVDATKYPNNGFNILDGGDHAHFTTHITANLYFGAAPNTNVPGITAQGNGPANWTSTSGNHNHGISGGDNETRPRNFTVNFYIRIN